MSTGLLTAWLPELRKRGASYLYLRQAAPNPEIQELAAAAAEAGIMPILPFMQYRREPAFACGVHFKSTELSLLAQYAPRGAGVVTASSHGSVDARLALQAGAAYVFVSPVFTPLSKPSDTRQPVAAQELQKLIDMHGDKIVLLGGMTGQRIEELRKKLTGSFSVAGISLFFSSAGHENP